MFAVLPMILMGIGVWFWTVAFAAGLYADWHLYIHFWVSASGPCVMYRARRPVLAGAGR